MSAAFFDFLIKIDILVNLSDKEKRNYLFPLKRPSVLALSKGKQGKRSVYDMYGLGILWKEFRDSLGVLSYIEALRSHKSWSLLEKSSLLARNRKEIKESKYYETPLCDQTHIIILQIDM